MPVASTLPSVYDLPSGCGSASLYRRDGPVQKTTRDLSCEPRPKLGWTAGGLFQGFEGTLYVSNFPLRCMTEVTGASPRPAAGDSARLRRAIERLARYPALDAAFPASRLRQRARNADARYWHPFLGPDSRCLSRLLRRLNLHLQRLSELESQGLITNVEERRKHLREASEIDDFNAARDEILYASELSKHFRVDFNQQAGPDITLEFAGGQRANVEFTAMLTSKSFHSLMAQLTDVQLESDPTLSYLVRVEYLDETEIVPDRIRDEIAAALEEHLRACPGPQHARLHRNIAQGISTGIRVTPVPVKPGRGWVVPQQGAAFGKLPPDLWEEIMDRIVRKSENRGQFPDAQTNVLVMDLILAQPLAFLYFGFGQHDIWRIFEGHLDMSRFPQSVESVVLTWTDVCGRGWPGGRIIGNPAAGHFWADTRNGRKLLRQLARPIFPVPK